ncbi:MAG: peptidase, partial [Daejeonella sp.]|nr:peptidase [Daejeonella sp.]
KASKVVKQYNNYEVFKGLKVNGSLTQGENIADIGGLAIAYEAFKNTKQGKSNDKIDGLTPDQRFFLSFAQVWRIKTRDETMRLIVTTDSHSPEIFRVNGTVVNMPAFYKAFNVKEGDKLFVKEENRVKIW